MLIRDDLSGRKFGRLTALRPTKIVNKRSYWLFRCDCGESREAMAQVVKAGQATECGKCAAITKQAKRTKHGGSGTRLHKIWIGVRVRCNNPKATKYERYGGRGIKVSAEWDDFADFQSWAEASGYTDELQLDRIDNDGDYGPNNCRWVTATANKQNTSRTLKYAYGGEMLCLKEIARRSGIHYNTLRRRLFIMNMGLDEALALRRDVWATRRLRQSA